VSEQQNTESVVVDLAEARANRWFKRLPLEDRALVRLVLENHPALTLAEALADLRELGGL